MFGDPVDDRTVVKIVALLAWFVWIQIAAAVLAEVAGQIRSRPAPSLPIMPGFQPVARHLVAGVVLGLVFTGGSVFPLVLWIITGLMAGILAFLMLFAVVPAVMIEGRGPVEALGRSRALARGAWGRILGVLAVLMIIVSIPSLAFGVAGAGVSASEPSYAEWPFTLRWADGSTVAFEVYRVDSYPKDAFPTVAVYGPTPGPELRLITCDGYDPATGSFDENLVVHASLVHD